MHEKNGSGISKCFRASVAGALVLLALLGLTLVGWEEPSWRWRRRAHDC
jgi:hypothetical protein